MAKNDASDPMDWIIIFLTAVGAVWAYSTGHNIVGTILLFAVWGQFTEMLKNRKRKKDEAYKLPPRPPPRVRARYPREEHEGWPALAEVKAALVTQNGGTPRIGPSLTAASAPDINRSLHQKRMSPEMPPDKELMEILSSNPAQLADVGRSKHSVVTENQKVEQLLTKLTAAAEALEFPAIGVLTVDLFWSIVEARPELSDLLLLAEREANRMRKACDEYDSVAFANLLRKVLSEGADSCLTESTRQKIIRAAAQLPQAGKDLDAPRIVTVIREAAALFLNRSALRQSTSVVIDKDRIRVGRFFSIAFRRTLRVSEDGKDYPLPPGFRKPFPIFRVQDYADKVPQHWLQDGGFFIPMHQREAMYLEFSGFKWHPSAAKVAVGNINAVTGEELTDPIRPHKQDYIVIPDQKWLDGINSQQGRVRQFVAMPLGKGYTIEEQVTDEARFGGIQIGVYEAREGLFPDEDPQALQRRLKELAAREEARKQRKHVQLMPAPMYMPAIPRERRPEEDFEMGLAAGGSIRQQIFEDQYGYQTWDEQSLVRLTIRIVDTVTFKHITGRDAPPTPVSAEHYTKAGLPWLRYYVEHAPTVGPSGILARIRGIRQLDRIKGIQATTAEPAIQIKSEQLRQIEVPTREERISELRQSCDACLRAKQYALGKRQADLLLELSPKDSPGLMIRASCNHRLARFQEAILDASECLEGQATGRMIKDALLLRAKAKYRLNENSTALLDLVKIDEEDPQYIDAKILVTEIVYKFGNYELAVKNADLVLQRSPNHSTALLYRGDSFFRLGEFNRAVSDFERVVTLIPNTKQAGYASEMLKKLKQAAGRDNRTGLEMWEAEIKKAYEAAVSCKRDAPSPQPDGSASFKNAVLVKEFLAERAEILKHKRFLSEKTGKDIGFEYALQDWIANHRANWQEQRRKQRNANE